MHTVEKINSMVQRNLWATWFDYAVLFCFSSVTLFYIGFTWWSISAASNQTPIKYAWMGSWMKYLQGRWSEKSLFKKIKISRTIGGWVISLSLISLFGSIFLAISFRTLEAIILLVLTVDTKGDTGDKMRSLMSYVTAKRSKHLVQCCSV